jgi:hypothetical protein
MQTYPKLDLKWHRLILAALITFVIADTTLHPQLSPGLLQTLAAGVQTHLRDGR